ncbi:MAG: hypothetical protein AAGC84_16630 [Pseudomonas sp.]
MSKPNNFTAKKHGTVVALQHSHPEQALEGLNRITGLTFARWPESLVPPTAAAVEEGETDFAPQRVTCSGL